MRLLWRVRAKLRYVQYVILLWSARNDNELGGCGKHLEGGISVS